MSDPRYSSSLWVLARRSEHAEAERLARKAIEINDATDMLNAQADAYTDLAEVLSLGGSSDAAAQALVAGYVAA